MFSLLYNKLFSKDQEVDKEQAEIFFKLGEQAVKENKAKEALEFFEKAVECDPKMLKAHMEIVDCYFQLKDFQKGLDQSNLIIDLDPNALKAHFTKGVFLFQLGRNDEALKQFLEFSEFPGVADQKKFMCYEQIGYIYMSKKDLQKTIEYFEKAVALIQTEFKIYKLLGLCYQEQQNLQKAVENFEKSKQLNPKDLESIINLGICSFDLREFKKAAENFGLFIEEVKPKDSQIYFFEGYSNLVTGEYQKGEKSFLKAIEYNANPEKDVEILNNLSICLIEQQKFQEALHWLEQIISKQENFYRAHYNKGITLLALERWQESLESFKKSQKLKPDFVESYEKQVIILKKLGDLEGIKKVFEEMDLAVEKSFSNYLRWARFFHQNNWLEESAKYYKKSLEIKVTEEALNNLGLAYIFQEKWDQALEQFNKVLEINPKYCEALYNIGLINQTKQNLDLALEFYQKALQSDPKFINAIHNSGIIYHYKKNDLEAIEQFKKVIEIDPSYVNSVFVLALCLCETQQYKEALKIINSSLENNQTNFKIQCAKGYVFHFLGIHEVALEQYDMVIELEPNFIDVFINKAILYREMGKYEQSLEWFEKSLKMVDSTEVAFSDKGILLIILGKFQEALECFEKSVQIQPENSLYQINLTRCLYLISKQNKDLKLLEETALKTQEISKIFSQNHFNPAVELSIENELYIKMVLLLSEQILSRIEKKKMAENIEDITKRQEFLQNCEKIIYFNLEYLIQIIQKQEFLFNRISHDQNQYSQLLEEINSLENQIKELETQIFLVIPDNQEQIDKKQKNRQEKINCENEIDSIIVKINKAKSEYLQSPNKPAGPNQSLNSSISSLNSSLNLISDKACPSSSK